jgi:hypothetical protein
MIYYCRLGSPATEVDTNLQLYSLQKAAENWNDLVKSIEMQGLDHVYQLKERLVFILSCFGLSLGQLLGQNFPSPDKKWMDQPGSLLGNTLTRSHIDQQKRRYLNRTFHDFLQYYDSLRHFGKNMNEKNYRTIDKLTIQEIDRFRRMTIEIWDIVIAMNDIEEIRSIADIVLFNDLAEQSHFEGQGLGYTSRRVGNIIRTLIRTVSTQMEE